MLNYAGSSRRFSWNWNLLNWLNFVPHTVDQTLKCISTCFIGIPNSLFTPVEFNEFVRIFAVNIIIKSEYNIWIGIYIYSRFDIPIGNIGLGVWLRVNRKRIFDINNILIVSIFSRFITFFFVDNGYKIFFANIFE